MACFLVRGEDGEHEDRVVQAPTMTAAIEAWRDDTVRRLREEGAYDDGDDERAYEWIAEVQRLTDEDAILST